MRLDSWVRRRCSKLSFLLPVVASSLAAVPISAQLGGVPGVNPADPRMMGNDWGIENEDVQGLDLFTVKAAYKKGLKYLKEGRCGRATEQFDRVLRALPENSSAHYLAGSADRCERRFRDAALHYKKAIKHDEEMYPAYKYLGISYLAVGDLESALLPLAQLEVKRIECKTSCPDELEPAYLDLKKVVEMAKSKAR